jgi:hypothetical protein
MMTMAKKQYAPQPIVRSAGNRNGEGSAVLDAKLQTFVSTDGKSVTQLGVDLSKADVPDRRYAADTCAVSYSGQTVQVIFGQERFDGQGLRNAIVVKMSPRGVIQWIQMTDVTMPASFMETAAAEGVEKQVLASANREPTQATVVLAANLALCAIAGLEGCVDFYEASPFAFGHALQQGTSTRLAVDPVVRVDLTTGLLFALLEELKRLISKFPVKFMEPAK